MLKKQLKFFIVASLTVLSLVLAVVSPVLAQKAVSSKGILLTLFSQGTYTPQGGIILNPGFLLVYRG